MVSKLRSFLEAYQSKHSAQSYIWQLQNFAVTFWVTLVDFSEALETKMLPMPGTFQYFVDTWSRYKANRNLVTAVQRTPVTPCFAIVKMLTSSSPCSAEAVFAHTRAVDKTRRTFSPYLKPETSTYFLRSRAGRRVRRFGLVPLFYLREEFFMSDISMQRQDRHNYHESGGAGAAFGSSALHGLRLASSAMFLLFFAALFSLTGCGSSGYAGGGIVSLSKSAVTLDAGQSFLVNANLSGEPKVTWILGGGACTANTCGAVSNITGVSATYTAPANITSQMQLVLTAEVSGTENKSTVNITVNPDPTISGNPPAGVVGVGYSSTLVAAGGTAPLTLSMVTGSLPAGLSFNSTTGVISGTPTAVGATTFTAQIIDSSDIPDTVTAVRTITIGTTANALGTIGGNPPAGTVGISYFNFSDDCGRNGTIHMERRSGCAACWAYSRLGYRRHCGNSDCSRNIKFYGAGTRCFGQHDDCPLQHHDQPGSHCRSDAYEPADSYCRSSL